MYKAPQSTPEPEKVLNKLTAVLLTMRIISVCCCKVGRVHRRFWMGQTLLFLRTHVLVSGDSVVLLRGEGAPGLWWMETGTLLISQHCP